MKITAKVNTKLKKQPIASSLLPKGEAIAVAAGKSYGVESSSSASDGHTKVTLAANSGTFFIFTAHWDGLSLITKQQAEAIFGNSITDAQLADLNECLHTYEISTPNRMRHFMSQVAHESGGLKWLQELATGDDYEWREDLGNVRHGDGRKYKGAGVIQLTGRANYQAFASAIADPKVMEGCDYVAATYPFTSAGFWWTNNNMNELCDRNPTVEQVTRRVNGGINGLGDRVYYYERCRDVI